MQELMIAVERLKEDLSSAQSRTARHAVRGHGLHKSSSAGRSSRS